MGATSFLLTGPAGAYNGLAVPVHRQQTTADTTSLRPATRRNLLEFFFIIANSVAFYKVLMQKIELVVHYCYKV